MEVGRLNMSSGFSVPENKINGCAVQVAVQRLGSNTLRIDSPCQLTVDVSHDTYAFKFKLRNPSKDPKAASQPSEATTSTAVDGRLASSVMLRRQQLRLMQQQLSKTCAQDPIVLRKATNIALQLASRSHDYAGPGIPAVGNMMLPAATASALAAQLCG